MGRAVSILVTFDNTGGQTISHALTLKGAASNLLSLRCDSAGTQWDISLLPGGVQSISYVDVQDSNAAGGVTLVAGATSTDSGNNINWQFGVSPSLGTAPRPQIGMIRLTGT